MEKSLRYSTTVFQGNPAGICPLNEWLRDDVLQAISTEMNLSETGFFVKGLQGYEIRWFTPETEVNLCGHATLAAGWVLVNELGELSNPITFSSRSGELRVFHNGPKFTLDFPAQPPEVCEVPDRLISAIGINPVEVLGSEDYLVVLKDEEQVRLISPNLERLKGLPKRGVIVTAQGTDVDFVSRWFGPNVGVPEDPVTGSAHTTLTPFWVSRLSKNPLRAKQISRRGGELTCELKGDRVLITGRATKFLDGFIEIPSNR